MNVARLLNQTCTITFVTQDGAPDAMGDPTETTTTATFKCWLSQASLRNIGGGENTRNENLQSQSLDLYLEPAAAALDGYDRVTVDGITYEVDGPPVVELNPRTLVVEYVLAGVRRTR